MKVHFRYSLPYDRMLTLMSLMPYHEDQIIKSKLYIKKIKDYWKKQEKIIIKEIEKVCSLKFKSDTTCFIVKHMGYEALSHPLTIKINDNLEQIKHQLIHELIHILFVQNEAKSRKLIESLIELYPDKDIFFKAHVPLCLVERKVIENLYGKSQFNKLLKEELKSEEENEVWPIANKMYPKFNKNIIKFFKKNALDRKISTKRN